MPVNVDDRRRADVAEVIRRAVDEHAAVRRAGNRRVARVGTQERHGGRAVENVVDDRLAAVRGADVHRSRAEQNVRELVACKPGVAGNVALAVRVDARSRIQLGLADEGNRSRARHVKPPVPDEPPHRGVSDFRVQHDAVDGGGIRPDDESRGRIGLQVVQHVQRQHRRRVVALRRDVRREIRTGIEHVQRRTFERNRRPRLQRDVADARVTAERRRGNLIRSHSRRPPERNVLRKLPFEHQRRVFADLDAAREHAGGPEAVHALPCFFKRFLVGLAARHRIDVFVIPGARAARVSQAAAAFDAHRSRVLPVKGSLRDALSRERTVLRKERSVQRIRPPAEINLVALVGNDDVVGRRGNERGAAEKHRRRNQGQF